MWLYYYLLAFRNARRDRLYASISILGLALGLCASLIITLYVDDELSYDRWIPDYQQIYRVAPQGLTGIRYPAGPSDLGLWLQQDYQQIDQVTRYFNSPVVIGEADISYNEQVTWADVNFFEVFALPLLEGELSLEQPDSVVITAELADKYFPDGNAIGRTLLFDKEYPMRVSAVIADLPSNTSLELDIIAAGHARNSPLAEQDRNPVSTYFGRKLWATATYMKLADPGLEEVIESDLDAMMDRRLTVSEGRPNSEIYEIEVLPLAALHLAPPMAEQGEVDRSGLYTATAIGFLILLAATINYVNLMTARGMKRAPEIAIRKTVGAGQGNLVGQFMVESTFYVLSAFVLAILLLLSVLPAFNGFMERTISLAALVDPSTLGVTIGIVLLTTLVAGAYPAIALSRYSPLAAFQINTPGRGGIRVRQLLSVVQFAILTGLLIASYTIYRQARYGIEEALNLDADPVVLVTATCDEPFKNAVRQIPEVTGVACAWQIPQFGVGPAAGVVLASDSERDTTARYTSVDTGLFEMFDLPLVAGRLFDEARSVDLFSSDSDFTAGGSVVVNEALTRELGFDSPRDAIGALLSWRRVSRLPTEFTGVHDVEVIGVLEDFQMGSIRNEIYPVVFYVQRDQSETIAVQFDGSGLERGLGALDAAWNAQDYDGPIERLFFDQAVEEFYQGITRQASLLTLYSLIAIVIALLGLLGLAAFVAEKRTKEIGIRKVLGGSRGEIVRLLLWQFSKPVLLSNLLAWPIALYYLNIWLNGFASHIALSLEMFIGAAALTLLLALTTVSAHAFVIGGINPVQALRYE